MLMDVIEREESGCGGEISVAVRNVRRAASFSYKHEAVVSSASVIKVPMLVEAMRQVRDGALSLDQEFPLADGHRVKGSGVMRYLHAGLRLTLEDLLNLMIIVSDNTATNILIDVLGTDAVNSTMRSMGYGKTTLRRRMYDWEMIDRGLDNVCAADEIADLLARIARGEALGGEWDQRTIDILCRQQDTDKLGLLLPQEAKLANKSGSREGVTHDCGIVWRGGVCYSIAVLTAGARSRGEAILAIARISLAAYESIEQRVGEGGAHVEPDPHH